LRSTYLFFEGDDYKNQSETFGPDPYPYGLKANRKMLEILFRSYHEERLTNKLAQVEDIFYRTTLDT
jgi:hypothetical protein